MQITAKTIATLVNGIIEGNESVVITHPAKIEEAGVQSITFLGNAKYEPYIYTTNASVVLVSKTFVPQQPIETTLIRVDDVYASLAVLMNNFNQIQHEQNHTISANSEIHATAAIGEGTHVGAYTVIEKNVNIGNGCRIGSNVYIGKDCKIGKNVILFSGVRIYYDCEIGDNCILHANAVIGSDGFGFAPQPDGTYKKIYQLGNVLIGNDVEIGANSTLDRASMGSTIIHDGVKIDNLVHVAHNVEIGKNTVIAAQTGVAGSTKIGENCMIGGQVGFAGHIKIADGTKIQAQSGIARSIETPNTAVFGSPAIPYTDFIKSYSVFQKLPDLYRKLTQLERKIEK